MYNNLNLEKPLSILIILTRPFRLGDFIEAQGKSGTVEEIHLFYTEVVTPDNIVNMIPNGILANGVIANKSIKDTRRVDEVFPISYATDFKKAEAVIEDVCKKNKLIFTDSVRSYRDKRFNSHGGDQHPAPYKA